ncbi:MAG: hypothetical protein AAF727_13275 [Pseudomonadota bacterium]
MELLGHNLAGWGRELVGHGLVGLSSVPFIVLDNGSGGTSVQVPDGGSVEVSLDDRPTVTLTDVEGDKDIGFLYAPSVTGSVITGSTLAIDLGIVFYEGDGPITIVQDILRDGTPIVSDIRASNAPEVYEYTVAADDIGATVQLRSVLTNGSNVVTVTTDLIQPGAVPILEAGAVGWWDLGDDDLITKQPGGVGTEITQFDDKSAAGNNLTQSFLPDMPDRVESAINGRQAAQFGNTAHMRLTPTTVRSAFFLVSNVTADNLFIAPLFGSEFDNTGASRWEHAFIRGDGSTGYAISVDGGGGGSPNSGTVYLDTGHTGSGGNITITGLSAVEREGTRLWYIAMDADMPLIDVIGVLRGSATLTYRNNGTLFGEVALFDKALTPAEANGVANDMAARWGLTWSDI